MSRKVTLSKSSKSAKQKRTPTPSRKERRSKSNVIEIARSQASSVLQMLRSAAPSACDGWIPPADLLADEQPLEARVEQYFSSPQAELTVGDPVLHPRNAKTASRGLPERENLEKLARVWLETAHDCWPELAKNGIIPPLSDKSVSALVLDFERRFLTGELTEFPWMRGKHVRMTLGAAYVRYSDDNSNPRSLDDQLRLQLRRAKDDKRFIPWQYVFADASVTGRTHLRRGYVLAKSVFERFTESALDTLYFDDFGRATRGAIESYRLARLMEHLRKRLIGVSDRFDLNAPGSDVLLMATAMFNEMFIKQLREKVLRGMRGAAKRGTVLGRLRFGYQMVQARDAKGKPLFQSDGSKIHVPRIDKKLIPWAEKAARMFTEELLPYYRIARHFNDMKVGDRDSWSASTISAMLASPLYIGVVIFNRTRTEFDPETGEFSVESNPRKDWVVHVDRKLKAWDIQLWRDVRRRASIVRRGSTNFGRAMSRNELYPSTLFSGTLFHECGGEYLLSRVAGGYQQLACANGMDHKYGCTCSASKSVRIIENSLLNYIGQHVLTEDAVKHVVREANKFLAKEADRPRVDTKPLRQKIKKLQAQEQKLSELVLSYGKKHDLSAYLKKGDKIRKEIETLQRQFSKTEVENAKPPKPIRLNDVLQCLGDLRGLLNQSVERSAKALRALTGRIVVHQKAEAGHAKPVWIGTFDAHIVRFLAAASQELGCLDSHTWEFLSGRNYTTLKKCSVRLEKVAEYEQIVPQVRPLLKKGHSERTIAAAIGKSVTTVRAAIKFLKTGVRPKDPRKTRTRKSNKPPRLTYKDILEEVRQLIDVEEVSIAKAARRLKVCEPTIRKAYDYLHPEVIQKAIKSGEPPCRNSRRRLGTSKKNQIKELIKKKARTCDIVAKIGCSRATVARQRVAMSA